MAERLQEGRERQLSSLVRRLHEIEERSRAAAHGLISGAGKDRRSVNRVDLEREARRLQGEAHRLEAEPAMGGGLIPVNLEEHLGAIEEQLEEAHEAREHWYRESLAGHRRRGEDREQLDRLKEENERLTAELMRCASLFCRDIERIEHPRVRRIWQMLRLAGT